MTVKLTREEAIQDLKAIKSFERYARGRLALDIAIDALKHERTDEWCTDCKEYDTEKNCCPRFNRVIRGAMKREPSEDGTLEVKVEDATKIGRVLISDDEHRGGLYYPDEYEPKGEDLISRTEAIEALGEEPPVWCDEEYEIAERDQWRADIEAIKSVPSADRPRTIEPTITVDLESGVVPISACEPKAPKTIIYADRPRGEWTRTDFEDCVDGERIKWARWNCSECGVEKQIGWVKDVNFCPNCGADMRGGDE